MTDKNNKTWYEHFGENWGNLCPIFWWGPKRFENHPFVLLLNICWLPFGLCLFPVWAFVFFQVSFIAFVIDSIKGDRWYS